MLTGQHFIGVTRSADQPNAFTAIAANTGEPLPTAFAEATSDEVDRAVRLADEAFDELQCVPAGKIAELLATIAELLDASGDELLNRIHAETALPLARLQMERGRTVAQTRRFAKLVDRGDWVQARIDRGDAHRKPVAKPDVRTTMTAVGPVAVFGASNFPLAISVAGTDTIAAFAARCPVVVKGHPGHPGSCERIADLICHAIAKTGLPAGIFSLLQGVGHEVGRALVQHPLTTAVAFTGSLQGGRAIMDAAAARPRPIPVYAEMGSTNPVFVMPQALEDAAATIAEGYVQSVNLGVGQFCTNPGLLLLPNGPTADVFLQAVKTAAEKVAAAPMLHAGILANYENGVAHLAECKGVQRLAAGGSADPGTAACSIFVADVELLSQQPSLADELFGPASLVLRCDRVEQMVECARHLGGHLTATIHGTEQELRYHAALVRLLQRRVGRVIFNGFPTGIEVCAAMHHGGPYPATGHSGFTSIGPAAIYRFVKPTCYQNFPDACLPPELQNANPLGITRLVDDQLSSAALD